MGCIFQGHRGISSSIIEKRTQFPLFLTQSKPYIKAVFNGLTNRLLTIDQQNIVSPSEISASLNGDADSLRLLSMRMLRRARVGIMEPNLRIGDIAWIDTNARLHLLGNDLYVRVPYHPFSTDEAAKAWVVDDAEGGALIWAIPGTLLLLR